MRVQLRLTRYLSESGTTVTWLAKKCGVSRVTVHDWLAGRTVLTEERQEQILCVLREQRAARQKLPLNRDLFRTEETGS